MNELVITGMNCANCARHVLQALQSVPGVENAEVSLQNGRASVRWKAGAEEKIASLIAAVSGAGYQATLAPSEGEKKKA